LQGLGLVSTVRVMKQKFFCATVLAAFLWSPLALFAQESPTAVAEREEFAANYKRMNTKIEQLEDTLQAYQKQIGTLVDEVHSLRGEVDRLKSRNESAATQESIKRLADKIEEVDKKRQADNELVISQLKALGKGLSKTAPREPVTPKVEKPPASEGNSPPEKAYEYKIKDGDTLVRIVADLRAQNYKVSQKQVMDANPGVNWSRLKIGQTIYIPPSSP
jgi:TolA-binding protein